jgi:hypothetical protein
MPEQDGATLNFSRPWHRLVWQVLESLNSDLLARARCWFGGGTRVAMELGEFRESVDVDFLCEDREGYRILRSTVTQSSLGDIASRTLDLMRDVRADMYGIRTFLRVDGQPVKFEVIFEGRIPLSGEARSPFPVEVLARSSCFAEKLLANADRGRDPSANARDLIDLAFMAANWPEDDQRTGMATAQSAYGDVVRRELDAVVTSLDDADYRQRCLTALSVSDTGTFSRGLRALKQL